MRSCANQLPLYSRSSLNAENNDPVGLGTVLKKIPGKICGTFFSLFEAECLARIAFKGSPLARIDVLGLWEADSRRGMRGRVSGLGKLALSKRG